MSDLYMLQLVAFIHSRTTANEAHKSEFDNHVWNCIEGMKNLTHLSCSL